LLRAKLKKALTRVSQAEEELSAVEEEGERLISEAQIELGVVWKDIPGRAWSRLSSILRTAPFHAAILTCGCRSFRDKIYAMGPHKLVAGRPDTGMSKLDEVKKGKKKTMNTPFQ